MPYLRSQQHTDMDTDMAMDMVTDMAQKRIPDIMMM